MIIHTFEKWNLLGFDIIKGSKAITFIEGLPYFNESQVKKKIKKHKSDYKDEIINNTEIYYDENTMPRAMESEADFYERKMKENYNSDGWGPMGYRS